MKITSRGFRAAASAGLLGIAATLGGCYVVPLQPPPSTVYHHPAPQPLPPAQITFSARLYPANDAAAQYGMVMAVVTNDLNGRGRFSTNIGGENFAGEATRLAGSSREGLANGTGHRGGYISCRYKMNSDTMGTGTCRLASGAAFTMHVGNQ
jgi:hypothetical protein